jgi:hypothetical protein
MKNRIGILTAAGMIVATCEVSATRLLRDTDFAEDASLPTGAGLREVAPLPSREDAASDDGDFMRRFIPSMTARR